MSSTTNLISGPSFTVETILFGSLVTAEVTVQLVPSTTSANANANISTMSRTSSSTAAITSLVMSTSPPTSSPTASLSSSRSHLSKGASIGIGVGLTVAVLVIICLLLWFFSFHKRYQDDADELVIGPHTTDYRRKGGSIDALSSRPPTDHDTVMGVQHVRTSSKGSKNSRENVPPMPTTAFDRPKALTPDRMSAAHDDYHDGQMRVGWI